jgi:hypothetical protein
MHIDCWKWLLFARQIPSLSLPQMGDMQMQNRIIAGDSLRPGKHLHIAILSSCVKL